MPKSSHKKGGAKKEYTGTYRHFTLHEVNGKEVDIGTATIKDHQTPLNAAKKLLSSWCRHQGIKSNERNKYDIKFCIRETTRGHSKIYGPYKGKFVKYDKPLMIKLKSGKVIKRIGKPMVKLAKGSNNKKMVGGQSNDKILITEGELRKLVNFIKGIPKLLIGKTNTRNENGKITEFNKKNYLYNEAVKSKINSKYIENNNYKLSNLDVSSIDNMANLFENFNFTSTGVEISDWNVSNVTNMESMFANSKGFNKNLNNWDVSNVTNMKKMFYNCEDLNQSFSNWKIQKDTLTNGMFTGCDKYKLPWFGFGSTYQIGIKRKSSNSNNIGTPVKNSNLKK